MAGVHERADDLGEPVLGLDLARQRARSARRASIGRAPTPATPHVARAPARTARGAAAAMRRERASAASSRSGSGRSPSPHICIARWAGYSSPDSQRSCASSASSPAAMPPHHCTRAMSRSAGRARHQMSAAASNGARVAASHASASSKSVGQVVERAHRGERPRVDARLVGGVLIGCRGVAASRTDAARRARRARRLRAAQQVARRPRARAGRAATRSFSARSTAGSSDPAAWSPSATGRCSAPRGSSPSSASGRPDIGQSGSRCEPHASAATHSASVTRSPQASARLLERLDEVAVRHPAVVEARRRCRRPRRRRRPRRSRQTMPMRVAAMRSISSDSASSGRSNRIAPMLRAPANGMSTRLRVGR